MQRKNIAAFTTEPTRSRVGMRTSFTNDLETGTATVTEFGFGRIFMLALRALHKRTLISRLLT
jgi:hypothetical protein